MVNNYHNQLSNKETITSGSVPKPWCWEIIKKIRLSLTVPNVALCLCSIPVKLFLKLGFSRSGSPPTALSVHFHLGDLPLHYCLLPWWYSHSTDTCLSPEILCSTCSTCTWQPISIRGIQRRMEYYARKAKISVSCHHLRHTMAPQMLNADADLTTIQDLLGHNNVKTT